MVVSSWIERENHEYPIAGSDSLKGDVKNSPSTNG